MGTPGTSIDAGGSSVLEDPTGRRARWLRRAGRVVFLLFLAWLLAIVLGGLGLMPVAGIPLTHALRPSQGPPVLPEVLKPRPPSPSDLLSSRACGGVQTSAPSATRRVGASPGKSQRHPEDRRACRKSRSPAARAHETIWPLYARGKSTTAPGKTHDDHHCTKGEEQLLDDEDDHAHRDDRRTTTDDHHTIRPVEEALAMATVSG